MVDRKGKIGFRVVLDNGVDAYITFDSTLSVEDKNSEVFKDLISESGDFYSGIRFTKIENNRGRIVDACFAAKNEIQRENE